MTQGSNSERGRRGRTTAARLTPTNPRHCNGASIYCDDRIFTSRKGTKAHRGVRLKTSDDYPAYSGPGYCYIAPSRPSIGANLQSCSWSHCSPVNFYCRGRRRDSFKVCRCRKRRINRNCCCIDRDSIGSGNGGCPNHAHFVCYRRKIDPHLSYITGTINADSASGRSNGQSRLRSR